MKLLEAKPDLYLDEIQEELQSMHGVIVGRTTIWSTLQALGLTRKKVRFYIIICTGI